MIVEAVPLDYPGTMEASQTGSHVVQARITLERELIGRSWEGIPALAERV
jgi:hypothetical protein